jgi:hypothetical protein
LKENEYFTRLEAIFLKANDDVRSNGIIFMRIALKSYSQRPSRHSMIMLI